MMHPIGDTIAQKYYILDLWSPRLSGMTYSAKQLKTGKKVLLSVFVADDASLIQSLETEAKILKQLKHPHLLPYLDYFSIETDGKYSFYLVQEQIEGHSLQQLIQGGWRPREQEIKQIIEQLLESLIYLHQFNPVILHQNINPENLLVDSEKNVFLCNLGTIDNIYSRLVTQKNIIIGSRGYLAPEKSRGKTQPSLDLYSVGTIVLFLLTHHCPSQFSTVHLTYQFRSQITLAEGFSRWLEKMLAADPCDRFSSAKDALKAVQQQPIYPPNLKNQQLLFWGSLLSLTVIGGLLLNAYKYPLLSHLGFTPYPFYTAIRNGDLATVQDYIDQGINVNSRDMLQTTPLHWSISNNHQDVAKVLLENGAKINARYAPANHQVIHVSTHHNDPYLTYVLLQYGADINATDENGYTPLHTAIIKPYVRNYYGMTGATHIPSLVVIDLLLKNGADINARDDQGKTPLTHVLERGFPEIEEYLIRNGGKI